MTAAIAYEMHVDHTVPSTITIPSEIFGPITVDATNIFTIPNGLIGFPDCHRFAKIATDHPHVYWLHAIETPGLAFLTIDPFAFFDDYTIDLHTPDIAAIAPSTNTTSILAIVTLPNTPGGIPTANLQGPVVLDTTTRTGVQLVLADGPYTVREPIRQSLV